MCVCERVDVCGWVCVSVFTTDVRCFPACVLPPPPAEPQGLSQLVERCLGGKPLSKAEQMSDWERRPLRPAQITYAGGLGGILENQLLSSELPTLTLWPVN